MFADSANNLVTGSRLLVELVGDGTDREASAEKMRACEHAGDEFTHAIMRRLNESFITPFDREDIYRLASSLDDVMDFMEAAADLVVLYEIDRLENQGDQVYRRLLAELFGGEYDALTVLKFKETVDQLESAVYAFENE